MPDREQAIRAAEEVDVTASYLTLTRREYAERMVDAILAVPDSERVELTDEMVERARVAGQRWFSTHDDGASSDDEWRDLYRAALEAALSSEPGAQP